MYRSGFDRLTLRSNIDSRVNNWLKLGVYFNTAYYKIQTNPFAGNNPDGGLSYMLEPFYSPVDENGKRKGYKESTAITQSIMQRIIPQALQPLILFPLDL